MFGNARLAWVLPGQLPTFALAAHVLGPRPADLSDAQFPRDPFAPGQVRLRLTVSGNAPFVKGLSYRMTASYAASDRGPYVVGPVTQASAAQSVPQLIPVDTFQATLGLRYEL